MKPSKREQKNPNSSKTAPQGEAVGVDDNGQSSKEKSEERGRQMAEKLKTLPSVSSRTSESPHAEVKKSNRGLLLIFLIAILVGCSLVLLFASIPNADELTAGPTPMPFITPVGQLPAETSTAPSSSEEEGGLPIGLIMVVFLVIAVPVGGYLLFGFPPTWPFFEVTAGYQAYSVNRLNGKVRVFKAKTHFVPRGLEQVYPVFTDGAIVLQVPERIVRMLPPPYLPEVKGTVRVKFDLEVQYRIVDVPIFVKMCQGKLGVLSEVLKNITIGLMETLSINFKYQQWPGLEEFLKLKLSRKFALYGVEIMVIQISNADIVDKRVVQALEDATVEASKAQAATSAAIQGGLAARQFREAAGMTVEQYNQFQLIQQAGPFSVLLQGFLGNLFRGAQPPQVTPQETLPSSILTTSYAGRPWGGDGEEEDLESEEEEEEEE